MTVNYVFEHEVPKKDTLLLYAGLDFILDELGHWHFIEANDHPVALNNADQIALSNAHSIFPGNGIATLTKELIRLSQGNPVCLLLPDCFAINAPCNRAKSIKFKDASMNEGRNHLSIEDFNLISKELTKYNHPCFIVDLSGVKIVGDEIEFSDGTNIGVLYRRSYNFPKKLTKTVSVNDLRLRSICSDKLKTTSLIKKFAPEVNAIPSYSVENENSLLIFIENAAKKDMYVIAKPRNGAGSRDVQRISAKILLKQKIAKFYENDLIYQPWIRPCTIRKNNFSYYVDVRVYVVSGDPIGGFARQAAAPTSGVMADSSLSWLTTSGPLLPISYIRNKTSESELQISSRQMNILFSQSKKIISILERSAAQESYSTICESIGDFQSQLDIEDKLKIIELLSCD